MLENQTRLRQAARSLWQEINHFFAANFFRSGVLRDKCFCRRRGHQSAVVAGCFIFWRRPERARDFVFRSGHLRHRRGVRLVAIQTDARAASPQIHGRRFQHHLGNVQNLSVPAGKISRRALDSHRDLHGLLFQMSAGKTVRRGAGDPGEFDSRHPRQLRRRVVRHPHQHHRQFAAPRSPRSKAIRSKRFSSRCKPA